jgi:hypothetical protein
MAAELSSIPAALLGSVLVVDKVLLTRSGIMEAIV